jgi:tetratricopeptide (TPR) repeat protein
MSLTRVLFWCLLAFAQPVATAIAQDSCPAPVGRFASLEGQVQLGRGEPVSTWRPAKLTDTLCKGDTIRAGERSRAAIALINSVVMRIDQNTTLRLMDVKEKPGEPSLFDLVKGAIQSFSRKPRLFSVNTPYLNGSIEGTEFLVRVDDDRASLLVLEGRVVVANERGQLAVRAGEAAEAVAGSAPAPRLVVRPQDAVQWSLYYPPTLSDSRLQSNPDLATAVRCTAEGDSACAFAAFEQIPPASRDSRFHLLRAALLLSVGRVEEAGADIDESLRLDPDAGDAYALRAVIAVTQNRRDEALADARQAVDLGPDSTAARIALSYALQADRQLEAARDTLLDALKKRPDDALAQARLAELWLMLGDRRAARAAAERAVQLQPRLARPRSVLGFVALAEIDTPTARAAFDKAIELDSADPLPHLGRGLALIRQGHLEQGRGELETAVALDSRNALLRAYLGKAYYEERREPLDAQQYDIAKQLDPLDPTSYFYDAIRLQTQNQPIEALREFDAALARNDNRLVYRSRLLLDQDRAARSVSTARAYSDLGFTQLGIQQATDAVTLDPTSTAAHRFLSDAYRNAPRQETARVSELQQAQMLQDVNLNPIQPSVGETNLGIVDQGGPARAGFNEFTPLFERNRAQVNLSGFAGSMDTAGGEAVVSGLYDRLSLSAGAFGYDTNGFRNNNDLNQHLYNLFAQYAFDPRFNVQAEYQTRDSEYGDLRMNFDPSSYSAFQRNHLETDSARVGARLDLSPRSTLLALYNYKDARYHLTDQKTEFVYPTPPFPPGSVVTSFQDAATHATSNQYEANYIYQAPGFNLLAGAAYAKVNRLDTVDVNLLDPIFGPPFPFPFTNTRESTTIDDTRAYVYANFVAPARLTWTVGLSQQIYDEDGDITSYHLQSTNPKLGAVWQAADTLKVRAAYFQALKPVLASNRTLEPTQIAGFNQYFDDADGTRSTRYGIGVDWQPSHTFAAGAELTQRTLKSAVYDQVATPPTVVFEDRDEWTDRIYAYWTPSARWAVSVEAVFDKFRNAEDSLQSGFVPQRVRTSSVPAKVTYFHPSGWFAGLGVTYVDQDVVRSSASTLPQGQSHFTLVDLAAGYRLPRRFGVLSLSVTNLFNQDFKYQDDSYRTFRDQPTLAPYIPQRVVMGRISLNF